MHNSKERKEEETHERYVYLRFEEILVENYPYREFLIGKVTVGKSSINVLTVYNPPKTANEPDQMMKLQVGLCWKQQDMLLRER